jgi:hypothetical protein
MPSTCWLPSPNSRRGSPDELLLHLLIARRIRFAADRAGCRGGAEVAATAQADFDIRRNETSFDTMRFADVADTATFIAATETALEPGDLLSVAAPAAPAATVGDAGFALAGTTVV